ncbi:hypothetical protein M5689_000671 [Euphorbia peplus]|nr:hypothetical protein M5689_000671 [Euphorbia peplus]
MANFDDGVILGFNEEQPVGAEPPPVMPIRQHPPRNGGRNGGGNDERSMLEILAPHRPQNRSAIVPPRIEAHSFELKTSIIQLVQSSGQFGGEMHENPNEHLDKFLMCANTTRINRVPQDTIRLQLFPFSLTGQALEWFHSLEPDSINSWEGLERAFPIILFSAV